MSRCKFFQFRKGQADIYCSKEVNSEGKHVDNSAGVDSHTFTEPMHEMKAATRAMLDATKAVKLAEVESARVRLAAALEAVEKAKL